ncbi:hypothetical protein [Parvularcula marina]|uniref:hypothetical protein n=1 Tax=Parvularcula marina TaxID=2292771 RepID=UPI0035152EF9
MTRKPSTTRIRPAANDNGVEVNFEADLPLPITPGELEVLLHFAPDLIAELDSANDNLPIEKEAE